MQGNATLSNATVSGNSTLFQRAINGMLSELHLALAAISLVFLVVFSGFPMADVKGDCEH